MPTLDDLDEILGDIISRLPRQFDSHQVIDLLIKRYPAVYEQLLTGYPSVTVTHAQISQQLHKFPHLLRKIGTRTSQNVSGEMSEAALWEKTY